MRKRVSDTGYFMQKHMTTLQSKGALKEKKPTYWHYLMPIHNLLYQSTLLYHILSYMKISCCSDSVMGAFTPRQSYNVRMVKHRALLESEMCVHLLMKMTQVETEVQKPTKVNILGGNSLLLLKV